MKNTKTTSKASKVITTLILSVLCFILSPRDIMSQDNANSLEGIMFNFVETSDKTVLQPYADALSSSMNSGLFHSAKVKKGFSIYFGLKGNGSYINGDNPAVKDANKTLSILPMAVPQVQVGSLFGTEISARLLPSISLGQYGSVGMWGIGIKHGITSHFKKSPVDVAVGFSMNSVNISDSKNRDLVSATSTAFNLQVSRDLSVFTFYTGVQYDNTSMDVSVNYQGATTKMNYENENNLKAILGLNVKLGPVNLNGDYSIGKTNTISAGFGFGF